MIHQDRLLQLGQLKMKGHTGSRSIKAQSRQPSGAELQ